MIDLTTRYAGLTLKSPVIVSSSGLTSSVDRITKMASAGAGAVVLKSLFEEQILHEIGQMATQTDYPEAGDYLKTYARENSLESYLSLIRKAKESVDIPVMASINCISGSEWVDFAAKIEKAGADALELNIYFLPIEKEKEPRRYEQAYLDLVSEVKKNTSLPLIINTDDLTFGSAEVLSSPADLSHSLRWIGIVSSQVKKMDLAASTGVHSGMAVVKQILAGASAVQVCSVLYRNGVEYIRNLTGEMKKWMEKHQFESPDDFRGRLNYSNLKDPAIYERAQFIRYFSQMH